MSDRIRELVSIFMTVRISSVEGDKLQDIVEEAMRFAVNDYKEQVRIKMDELDKVGETVRRKIRNYSKIRIPIA